MYDLINIFIYNLEIMVLYIRGTLVAIRLLLWGLPRNDHRRLLTHNNHSSQLLPLCLQNRRIRT